MSYERRIRKKELSSRNRKEPIPVRTVISLKSRKKRVNPRRKKYLQDFRFRDMDSIPTEGVHR